MASEERERRRAEAQARREMKQIARSVEPFCPSIRKSCTWSQPFWLEEPVVDTDGDKILGFELCTTCLATMYSYMYIDGDDED
jgi:hypothetical protein